MSEKQSLFIPKLGTVIKLEEDWTFPLYNTSKNRPLADALGFKNFSGYTISRKEDVTLKKGTTLVVDKVIIKQDGFYDKFFFRVDDVPDNVSKKIKRKRFWVHLAYANEIKFSVVSGEPRCDGLLFVLKKSSQKYKKVKKIGTYFNLEKAKKIVQERNDADRLYIFKVPDDKSLPSNYRDSRRVDATFPISKIEKEYELVYEPLGPLGKGSEVKFKRKKWDSGVQWLSRCEDLFIEENDKKAIKNADSIYLMHDRERIFSGYTSRPYNCPAVIFRTDDKWQARLSGKMREESPKLYKKVCDIWQSDGYIPVRTLSGGVALLEDFFEENLTSYASSLVDIEQYHRNYW